MEAVRTTSIRPMRPRRQGGFTLIELMVVIAIMGIVGAMAVPTLDEERKGRNHDDAVAALQAIDGAQSTFYLADFDGDSINDYGRHLLELVADGGLDNVVGGGLKSGYAFPLKVAPDPRMPTQWNATAEPIDKQATGTYYFYIDQTGALRYGADGADEASPELVGPVPPPVAVAPERDKRLKAAASAIGKLDKLSPGAIAGAITALGYGGNIAAIVAELDRDGDTNLSWEEVLGTELLLRARAIKGSLGGLPPEGGSIGADRSVTAIADAYAKSVRKISKLHVSEYPLPEVATGGLDGDAVAFLSSLP